jgi:hypothetical protein
MCYLHEKIHGRFDGIAVVPVAASTVRPSLV